jgi:hypothetical protein
MFQARGKRIEDRASQITLIISLGQEAPIKGKEHWDPKFAWLFSLTCVHKGRQGLEPLRTAVVQVVPLPIVEIIYQILP